MRVIPILKWKVIVVVALVIAAASAVTAPVLLAQAPAGQESGASEDSSVIDAATEVEIQRRFNELRREILDDRADSIGWWLSGIALLLAVLVLIFGFAGYLVFMRLRNVEEEVRRNVERARVHAEEAGQLAEENSGLWRGSGRAVARHGRRRIGVCGERRSARNSVVYQVEPALQPSRRPANWKKKDDLTNR